MGQLDEAIRAHLELKRKHGASEEELQAEEQEALGPVRREEPSQAVTEPEPDAEVDAEEELDVEEEPELVPVDSFEEPAEDFEPEAFDEPAESIDSPEHVELADPLESAELEEPLPAPGHEPAFVDPMDDPLGPPERDPEPVGSATPPRGFDAVEDDVEEDDNVLEETPDFLQETPEHDRLWFEQKPPRDFDFDE